MKGDMKLLWLRLKYTNLEKEKQISRIFEPSQTYDFRDNMVVKVSLSFVVCVTAFHSTLRGNLY